MLPSAHERSQATMIDAVVLGAGPAGLAASAALTERGVEHVVLEGGRVGESWRTQRWDSFRLNTAGWMNSMLGSQARDAYAGGQEVVQRLERLAAGCPVRDGVRVARLAPARDHWAVATDDGELRARAVVVATGDQNRPRVPARWPAGCQGGSPSSTPPATAAPASSPPGRCWSSAAPSRAARSPRTSWPAAAGSSWRPAPSAACPSGTGAARRS